MELTVSQQLSTNKLLRQARFNVPSKDPEGFWENFRVEVGRGYSSQTFACTQRLNGVYVHHAYYQPGPFDHIAYGPDSIQAYPASTYTVYCGVEGLKDDAYKGKASCIRAVSAENPSVDLEALSFGKFGIWFPDGEGALYVDFGDEDIEAALAFADSLNEFVEA